jgi:hypothetical protein
MTAIDLLKQAAEQFLIRLLPDDKARVGAFNDKIQFNALEQRRSADHRDVKNMDYGSARSLVVGAASTS